MGGIPWSPSNFNLLVNRMENALVMAGCWAWEYVCIHVVKSVIFLLGIILFVSSKRIVVHTYWMG